MMADKSVMVVARLTARQDTIEQVRAILLGLIGPTRKEQGCIRYQLHQNAADPADFTFVEEWTSDAALDAHFTTPHLEAAADKLETLLASEPDIRRYALLK